MNSAVEQFNGLNGTVADRTKLKRIAVAADLQGQKVISAKLEKLLRENPDDSEFDITLSQKEIDRLPEECLGGLECLLPDEDFEGLEKAVSPDEIYQMITDKMLDQLKEASGNGYKKKWRKQNDKGYLLPFNFDTKKMYRGINIPLLTEGMSKVLENPYFLTFNQIEKHKGKLKKGSKGLPVVYFTMLYAVSETNEKGDKIEFGTYNKKKYLAWLNKNIGRLKFSLDYYKNQYIPILKYYNVFNGADVENIDFDLDNFKIGYQDGSEVVKNNDHRVEIADLIVKHYPKPQPQLRDSKDGGAFYRHNITGTVDEIHMPKFEDFETGLDYYRTLFHEFTHSTGISSRMNRPMGGKFGSPKYAKEELVAEFGAVFLSAHAGIIWYNQKNHAEYLKNWNNALTHIKEDNRFIMRAASAAQAAADFILNLDKEGVPAYQNSLKSELKKKGIAKDVSDLRAKTLKEYNRKIELLNGYLELEEKQNKTIEKLNYLSKDDEYRAVLEEEIKKQEDALLIQADQGAKFFKITENDFIDIVDLYSEDKTAIRSKLKPAKKEVSKPAKPSKSVKKKKPKVGEQLGLFGAVPEKPTRKGTMAFAEKHLIGKSYFVDAINEKVHFAKAKIKHAMTPGSKENLALIYKLPNMLKKAVLLSEQPDKKKRNEIKKVFKLVLVEELFGEAFRVLITVRKQDKNYYYDHAVIDTIKPEKQHGSVNEVNPIPLDVASPVPNKDSKKSGNQKKKGLNAPAETEAIATVPQREPIVTSQPKTIVEPQSKPVLAPQPPKPAPVVVEEKPVPVGNPNSLAARMQRNQNRTIEYYKIDDFDLSKFLGQVEIKEKESVGISITAPQGAGKTRFAFQLINAFAKNYKVGHASMEEHPDSGLYESKAIEYIEPQNLANIDAPDINSMSDIEKLIRNNDVIVIDSFEKLREIDKNVQVDQDFRKKHDGKLFIFIFQLTSDGKMRGGSKSQFDVDIVLETEKFEDYRDNYIYPNKNRYNSIPPSELKFNIYNRALVPIEGATEVPDEDPQEPSTNSRVPEFDPGELIITPID